MEVINEEPLIHISGKHWSPEQRHLVFQFLLSNSNGGCLGKKNLISRAALKFGMPMRTVERIWSKGKNNLRDENSAPNFSSNMKGNVGRKRINIDFELLRQIPFRKRATIRSTATAMGVSSSTIYRRKESGFIQPHTNAIKPKLTEENKLARLRHCLSMISQPEDSENFMFNDMMNVIHIDEKWFMMSKDTQRYYKLPDENPPLRSCKSKKFIDKVMFMGCVARSRFDVTRSKMFDGKLGIFPFVYEEPAKRSSKNRPAGTMQVKPIQSITKDVIRKCLIEKLLPAIREHWPGGNSETIWIQQDNARPHVDPNDKEFVEAAAIDGYDIRLCYQPPNSPDMNVLDLGYFRAIQSLQQQEAPSSIEELIEAVEKSFHDLHHDKLNKIFLTLQLCMLETMKVDGCNNYKQPHFKDTAQINGYIPLQLQCDESLLSLVRTKCSV